MTTPVGILASSKRNGGTGDRLVRANNTVRTFVSGTQTLNFTEGTALDSTHLLVAIITINNGDPITVSSGWTLIESQNAATTKAYVYARQGNGSVNGIGVSQGGFNTFNLQILAFSGYISTTPSQKAKLTDSTTAAYVWPSLPATPSISGVVVAAIGSDTAPSSYGSFTNSYNYVPGTPATGLQTRAGLKEYTGSGGSYSTQVTWVSGGGAALFILLWELS